MHKTDQYIKIQSEIDRRKSDSRWRRAQNAMLGTAILLMIAGIAGLGVLVIHGQY